MNRIPPRMSTEAKVALAVGAVVLIVMLSLASIFALQSLRPGRSSGTVPTTSAPKLWTREEFKALVLGKTTKEVLELVGPPADTSDQGGSYTKWRYRGVTRDTISGRTDGSIYLYVKNDKVTEVTFP